MSIKVEVKSNESLEAALRRFKRQCNYGGVFRLAKANTWHEKRSDKRRRERRERMRTIRDLVKQQRSEPALPLVDEIASLMSRFPTAVSAAAFGTMLKGVDFITSNVPGPPFDVYLAGARVERILGFGPLSGAAVNLTLFSYNGELGVGINTDKAAVPDPDRLRSYLLDEFEALGKLAQG